MIEISPILASVPAKNLSEWLESPKLPVVKFSSENVYELKRYLDNYGFELTEAVYIQPVLVYNDLNLHEVTIELNVSELRLEPNSELDTPVAKLSLDDRFNVTQVEFHDTTLAEAVKNCAKPFLSAKMVEFRTKPIWFTKIIDLAELDDQDYIHRVMIEKDIYTLVTLQRLVSLLKYEARKHSVSVEWRNVPRFQLVGKRQIAESTEEHAKVKFDAELYSNGSNELLVGVIDAQLRNEPVLCLFTSCMGNETQYLGDHFHTLPFRFIVAFDEQAKRMFADEKLNSHLDRLWKHLAATVYMSRSYVTEPVSCASTSSAAKALSRQAKNFEPPDTEKARSDAVSCVAIFENGKTVVKNSHTMVFVRELPVQESVDLVDLKLLHNNEVGMNSLAMKLGLSKSHVLSDMLQSMRNLELLFEVRDCELVLAYLVCACANSILGAHPTARLTGFLPFKTKQKIDYRHFILVSYAIGTTEYASLYEVKYLSSRTLTHEPRLQDGSTKQAWKLHHIITGELLQDDHTLLISNQHRTCAIRFDESDQQLHIALNDLVTIDDLRRLNL